MLFKQWQLLISGLLSLLIGTLVYLFNRPPQSTYFLPEKFTFYQDTTSSFLILTGSLPSFCHVLGFSLVVLALKPNSKYIGITCLFWLMVNIFFELSQQPQFTNTLTNLNNIPLANLIKNYAKHGTFALSD